MPSTSDNHEHDHISRALFGLVVVAIIVALAILATGEVRPSIEYQLHKSELINWGLGS